MPSSRFDDAVVLGLAADGGGRFGASDAAEHDDDDDQTAARLGATTSVVAAVRRGAFVGRCGVVSISVVLSLMLSSVVRPKSAIKLRRVRDAAAAASDR